jgi:hypothetical protein
VGTPAVTICRARRCKFRVPMYLRGTVASPKIFSSYSVVTLLHRNTGQSPYVAKISHAWIHPIFFILQRKLDARAEG